MTLYRVHTKKLCVLRQSLPKALPPLKLSLLLSSFATVDLTGCAVTHIGRHSWSQQCIDTGAKLPMNEAQCRNTVHDFVNGNTRTLLHLIVIGHTCSVTSFGCQGLS